MIRTSTSCLHREPASLHENSASYDFHKSPNKYILVCYYQTVVTVLSRQIQHICPDAHKLHSAGPITSEIYHAKQHRKFTDTYACWVRQKSYASLRKRITHSILLNFFVVLRIERHNLGCCTVSQYWYFRANYFDIPVGDGQIFCCCTNSYLRIVGRIGECAYEYDHQSYLSS